jgi:hypothetical protein
MNSSSRDYRMNTIKKSITSTQKANILPSKLSFIAKKYGKPAPHSYQQIPVQSPLKLISKNPLLTPTRVITSKRNNLVKLANASKSKPMQELPTQTRRERLISYLSKS